MKNTSKDTGSTDYKPVFDKYNYSIIMLACIMIVTGFFLMSGEASTNEHFNPDIFSHRRIVVAPAVCLAGYLMMIVGIVYRHGKK